MNDMNNDAIINGRRSYIDSVGARDFIKLFLTDTAALGRYTNTLMCETVRDRHTGVSGSIASDASGSIMYTVNHTNRRKQSVLMVLRSKSVDD